MPYLRGVIEYVGGTEKIKTPDTFAMLACNNNHSPLATDLVFQRGQTVCLNTRPTVYVSVPAAFLYIQSENFEFFARKFVPFESHFDENPSESRLTLVNPRESPCVIISAIDNAAGSRRPACPAIEI
jgi:hypothetical protein